MQYKQAKITDIDEICRLITSAIAEMESHEIHQWDEIYPAREDFLDDIKKGNLTLGLIDGEIAVIYTISKEYDEQYQNGTWAKPESDFRVIHRLCVNPAFQNRGIARDTLSHIEKELSSNGVESIRLDVFTQNPYALSLYRHQGYREVGTAHWRKGTFLLMEKYL